MSVLICPHRGAIVTSGAIAWSSVTMSGLTVPVQVGRLVGSGSTCVTTWPAPSFGMRMR